MASPRKLRAELSISKLFTRIASVSTKRNKIYPKQKLARLPDSNYLTSLLRMLNVRKQELASPTEVRYKQRRSEKASLECQRR
jgi:hypothetical protein